MALELKQIVGVYDDTRLELQPPMAGVLYELVDFWTSSPKHKLKVPIGEEMHEAQYVLAPERFLQYVKDDEPFGIYVGDMTFISAELAKEHPTWVPYIALKLVAQRHINEGLDESGRARHWQALFGAIRVAGLKMDEPNFRGFIEELAAHENSGYFELDDELNDFLGGNDPLTAKRKYLDHHRNNRWVTEGRKTEIMEKMGLQVYGRNHAEAVFSEIDDRNLNLYAASVFVRAIRHVPHGEGVLISPPYNAIAYAMTRDANGVVDLLNFRQGVLPDGQDIVFKKGRNRNSTWTALIKRLGYQMHIAERNATKLLDSQKEELEGLVVSAEGQNALITADAARVEELVTASQFEAARAILEGMPGHEQSLARLGELTRGSAESLALLEASRQLLEEQI
ncbi:hypothetical protein HOD38_03690 [archaeon]|jgi:hypothetical protein|nr:hypothetical protein [archaeon]MBT4397343.1 hypothetical protein [archaeon]MBT4440723.1 hypothetical protein [archaeon]